MSLMVEKLLESEISITEEEIKTYFEEHKEEFAAAEKVKEKQAAKEANYEDSKAEIKELLF